MVDEQKGWRVTYWNHEGEKQSVFLGNVIKWVPGDDRPPRDLEETKDFADENVQKESSNETEERILQEREDDEAIARALQQDLHDDLRDARLQRRIERAKRREF